MTAVTTSTIVTKDTEETIHGVTVLRHHRENFGYDWMELISGHDWTVLGGWGCDGWDLGQWPYVMLAVTLTADERGPLFGVATYIEGDVTCEYYRTQARQWDAITEHAFGWWKGGMADGPADLPEAAAELPSRYRQPYRVHAA